MRKSNGRRIICLAALLFFLNVSAVFRVSAAEDAAIVEKFTTQDGIVLYVKGLEGTAWEAAYQVGTNACAVEDIHAVRETGETIYTLILWDNSLSVMNRQGDRIREILLDIMANRSSMEQFAIALIDHETSYLTEYTDDYAALKQAVEAVEGQNQDAYIIENLYEAILSLNQIPDFGYKRIILISDGMDAVEVGYSRAELDALIEKSPYPIYTIGMLDGGHTEELQNLFALSRTTGAEYFYLNELEDSSAVARTMSAELNILRINVLVPEEMRDGSVQNSQLVLESGAGSFSLQCQVTLPFAQIETGDGAEQNGADAEQGDAGLGEEDQSKADDAGREEMLTDEGASAPTQADALGIAAEKKVPILLIGCLAGAAVLIFIVVMVIVFSKKKKGNEDDHYAKLDQRLKNERYRLSEGEDAASSAGAGDAAEKSEKTEFEPYRSGAGSISGNVENSGSGSTRLLFDEPFDTTGKVQHGEAGRRILLRDMANDVRTYGCGISDRVVIGRSNTCCNLAITTDNAVSERHCEIECRGERLYIRDLGSSNGTYVNGTRIDTAVEVQTGTVIKIGRTQYRLTIE